MLYPLKKIRNFNLATFNSLFSQKCSTTILQCVFIVMHIEILYLCRSLSNYVDGKILWAKFVDKILILTNTNVTQHMFYIKKMFHVIFCCTVYSMALVTINNYNYANNYKVIGLLYTVYIDTFSILN